MIKIEDFVYLDLQLQMSTKQMADVLYAGIQTGAKFTTLWTLTSNEYTRKQNSRNNAYIKVCIHPSDIDLFNKLSGLKLETPPVITGC